MHKCLCGWYVFGSGNLHPCLEGLLQQRATLVAELGMVELIIQHLTGSAFRKWRQWYACDRAQSNRINCESLQLRRMRCGQEWGFTLWRRLVRIASDPLVTEQRRCLRLLWCEQWELLRVWREEYSKRVSLEFWHKTYRADFMKWLEGEQEQRYWLRDSLKWWHNSYRADFMKWLDREQERRNWLESWLKRHLERFAWQRWRCWNGWTPHRMEARETADQIWYVLLGCSQPLWRMRKCWRLWQRYCVRLHRLKRCLSTHQMQLRCALYDKFFGLSRNAVRHAKYRDVATCWHYSRFLVPDMALDFWHWRQWASRRDWRRRRCSRAFLLKTRPIFAHWRMICFRPPQLTGCVLEENEAPCQKTRLFGVAYASRSRILNAREAGKRPAGPLNK